MSILVSEIRIAPEDPVESAYEKALRVLKIKPSEKVDRKSVV